MHVRNSAKAIIISGDKVLLTKNQDKDGYFYLFPGGGQEHGETIHQALIRECVEEMGHQVEVGELLHIREYIGRNHEHWPFDYNLHQVEYYFTSKIVEEAHNDKEPTNPDSHQVGMEWVPVNDLLRYRLYPKELRKYIMKYFNGVNFPVYLGDMN